MAKDQRSEAAKDQGHETPEESLDPMTYRIRGTETAKELTVVIRCGLCRQPLEERGGGWCFKCNTFPINVTPRRLDAGGHRVAPDGFCGFCGRFVLSRLEATAGEWYDTGQASRLVTTEEDVQQSKSLQRAMAGKGWPDRLVPLRRDMIPRSWKRRPLSVVGSTPLGFEVVIPSQEAADALESEVPF